MVGQAIWRSCALVLTGGIPSWLCGPRLGSLRSSRFSAIATWKKYRLNSPLPRCRYRWRRLRFPIFKPPRPVGFWVQKLLSTLFSNPFTALSSVWIIMATPGGIPTLSDFHAVISSGRNIILGVAVDPSDLLLLKPKALSFKVKLFNFFTLSDSASAPSRQSFARIRPAYSRIGPMSSASEGQWSM